MMNKTDQTGLVLLVSTIMMRSTKKISPDSVVSSMASTILTSTTDQVVRELFPISQEKENNLASYQLDQSIQIEVDSESNFGSDVSVASEGTHASFNDGRISRIGQNMYDDTDSPIENNSEVKAFPGCHGAFHRTPKNFSTMFNVFDASRKKDEYDEAMSNSVNDAVTEVASNIDQSVVFWERKIDSLEREIKTLKGIIKSDSVTILQLKTELSTFKEKELLLRAVTCDQCGDLTTEQTVQGIIEEIEVSNQSDGMSISDTEAQLRLENKAFASQIVNSETEIQETRDIISQIAESNVRLNMELSELRTQTVPHQEYIDNEVPTYKTLQSDMIYLESRMRVIEHRIESGCFCRCAQNDESTSSRPIRPRSNIEEPMHDELFSTAAVNDNVDDRKPQNESDCTDIEVSIDGTIITIIGSDTTTQEMECNTDHTLRDTGSEQSPPYLMQNLENVETDCNFCDCLRTASPTIDSNIASNN
jgi:hypothetical protein